MVLEKTLESPLDCKEIQPVMYYSGVSVPREDLKPGDVICYDYGTYCGHVAI